MSKGPKFVLFAGIILLAAMAGVTLAADGPAKDDVFKGKLFPPNLILENQGVLNLSKEQFTKIRAAVVEVQAGVAEHEWDMREAYLQLMAELDNSPINENRVLEHADAALLAENKVKKRQISMLVRLKNLLTPEQVSMLESIERRDRQ
ncbi:MAG: hypothetical protein HKN77_02290 [Woeseiaceae bacterium]|nr:hypothetical protein [Woeseiaceae bacterium]